MVFSITIKIKSIYKRKCLYWWVILWNHESSKTSSPPLILVISLVKDMAHPRGWGHCLVSMYNAYRFIKTKQCNCIFVFFV